LCCCCCCKNSCCPLLLLLFVVVVVVLLLGRVALTVLLLLLWLPLPPLCWCEYAHFAPYEHPLFVFWKNNIKSDYDGSI
jgi:hypothetical protein